MTETNDRRKAFLAIIKKTPPGRRAWIAENIAITGHTETMATMQLDTRYGFITPDEDPPHAHVLLGPVHGDGFESTSEKDLLDGLQSWHK